MYGVVDRFEGEYAVLQTDDGEMLNIRKNLLPVDIHEGDVVDLNHMTIDKKETFSRKNDIRKLAEELFK
ncbi:MAG: DUF3006 domain-containing protein [Tepidanaerobacteraceae bacterium]|nr:DUF3006 domain-containing protein [Tepidanaerobacteraceae bacterium]